MGECGGLLVSLKGKRSASAFYVLHIWRWVVSRYLPSMVSEWVIDTV